MRSAVAGFSWLAAAACLSLSAGARAAVTDPAFTETLFLQATTHITGLAWAPDGSNRLFYTRKNGQVRIIENGAPVLPVFASIAPIITSSECGLIGIAFDPDFVNTQYVYLFVTVAVNEQQIIRYRANGNIGEDKTVVVSGLPTRSANHDGGAVGFGPDGLLYWAVGDTGNRTGVDADLQSLASKVGRAHRDGRVPVDNPFFDGDGPNNDYIWARGFRNPFTLTFNPITEQLWVNVAGDQYEQVFAVGAGDHAGWDDYQSNQPAGYIPPVISYRNDAVDNRPISAATRQTGVATFTTSVAHRFRPGAKITVAGVGDPSFDGTAFVSAVPSTTQFSVVQAGAAATSTGGTASSQPIGGAVTGGVFWDASGVPASYRNNFFFGDYNSGRLMRATFGAANQVASVDEWGTGIVNYVDMDVGPDGALYYAATTGEIYRAAYDAPSQGLVVSRLHVRTDEGGGVGFAVSLAQAPAQNRAVAITRATGDSDISVASASALSFTPANWNVPQPVLLAAAQDADSFDDEATIAVSSNGLTTQNVRARVTDDDAANIVLSSVSLEVTEGEEVGLRVSLSEPPASPVTVNVAIDAGGEQVLVEPASLVFDADDWNVAQEVVVAAGHDGDAVDGAATLTISASSLPERSVSVAIDDDDESAPVITSQAIEVAVEDAPYSYDVEADGLPVPAFSLDEAPSGMTIDAATGLVQWVPQATGPASVSIRAANGVVPDDVQTFVITVSADQAPTCELSAPVDGAVIGGALGEFFGDVYDDVGAVRARFSVDGSELWVDENDEGHYHFGSAHNAFDTTAFADGEHTLKMSGEDTSGQTCAVEVTVTIDNGGGGAGGATGNPGTAGEGGHGATLPDGGGSALGGQPSPVDGGGPGSNSSEAGEGGEATSSQGSSGADGGCSCRSARSTPTPVLTTLLWLFAAGLRAGSRRRRLASR